MSSTHSTSLTHFFSTVAYTMNNSTADVCICREVDFMSQCNLYQIQEWDAFRPVTVITLLPQWNTLLRISYNVLLL